MLGSLAFFLRKSWYLPIHLCNKQLHLKVDILGNYVGYGEYVSQNWLAWEASFKQWCVLGWSNDLLHFLHRCWLWTLNTTMFTVTVCLKNCIWLPEFMCRCLGRLAIHPLMCACCGSCLRNWSPSNDKQTDQTASRLKSLSPHRFHRFHKKCV